MVNLVCSPDRETGRGNRVRESSHPTHLQLRERKNRQDGDPFMTRSISERDVASGDDSQAVELDRFDLLAMQLGARLLVGCDSRTRVG